MYWVIDTDVLVRADKFDMEHDHFFNVNTLLLAIRNSDHTLAVDHAHRILNEYRRRIDPNGWVAKFLAEFEMQRQVYTISGRLTNRMTNQLRALAFDPDDYVFVAVAHNAPDSRLVAEESDYTTDVVSYLSGEGVSVLDCIEAAKAVGS